MFGGHWSNPNGDKKSLICNVTPQNHMIEGSRNSTSGNSSLYVTILSILLAIGIAVLLL